MLLRSVPVVAPNSLTLPVTRTESPSARSAPVLSFPVKLLPPQAKIASEAPGVASVGPPVPPVWMVKPQNPQFAAPLLAKPRLWTAVTTPSVMRVSVPWPIQIGRAHV